MLSVFHPPTAPRSSRRSTSTNRIALAARTVTVLGTATVLGLGSALSGYGTDTAQAAPKAVQPDTYEGQVEVVRGGAEDPEVLTGTVFNDKNEDSTKDRREKGISGVAVSNGIDVVTTDSDGVYELPVRDNMTVFVTQPAGWQVPVDEYQFAQFSWNHLPEGSPDLKYGGIAPTGDLPKAVNFPMAKSKATARTDQSCPIASDTQAYDMTEIGYARDGAVSDLAQREDYGGCGVLLLGDNVGDDLSLNPALKDIYRDTNGPIRAVLGNHDMDFDAPDQSHMADTFRNDFGPTSFSYDVGEIHFVVLNSIEYPLPAGSDRQYNEKITAEHLQWLENDLENVAKNKQIVIASHAPIVNYREMVVDNAPELYELLEGRKVITIGGHTHTLENLPAGSQRAEWAESGIDELPFRQLVAGAVSGDWYSGDLNSEGLPFALMSDGAQPGVMTLDVRGSSITPRYTIRRESDELQMGLGINSPSWREWAEQAQQWQDNDKEGDAPELGDAKVIDRAELESGEAWLTTNFYTGNSESRVEVRIDGGRTRVAEHTQPNTGEELRDGWEWTDPYGATRNLQHDGNVPTNSSHLWRYELPADLSPGTHTAKVTATDEYGREFTETIRFTVTEERTDQTG
ncbi:calcineurin-like phosphoesterase C-terminal domain-containing protein [Naumannella halotolerans]|uniref:calcineurin-like phosphoesterase C-terminal domain-containing protein n=1 Tax=Naumannella halotolerans TaxID=993414 RepID=UPI00370D8704